MIIQFSVYYTLRNYLEVWVVFTMSSQTVGPPNSNGHLASLADEVKGGLGIMLFTLP